MATTQTKEALQGRCTLLALPGELRNHVYELIATQDTQQDERSIDLFAARPPGASLLRTCRQIHAEAKGIVSRAAEHYWSFNHFTANLTSRKKLLGLLDLLGDDTISFITRITLRVDVDPWPRLVWSLEDRIWTLGPGEFPLSTDIVVEYEPRDDVAFDVCPFPGNPVGGKRMGYVGLASMTRDRFDELKQRYGVPKLTRRELEWFVRMCVKP